MTNLTGLAEYPDPPFTCKQFSSYDRKSKSPDEDWFANADCGQYLRVEENDGRKEWVMMDTAGPGAVVRIWSANPQGNLRVYLDGSTTPALEGPMTELLGGTGIVAAPLSAQRSKGWNLYLPIPYAKQFGIAFDPADLTGPVIDWTPSPGLSSMVFYEGDAFPAWRGHLLQATLAGRDLYRLELDVDGAHRRETLVGGLGRFRDVEVDAKGNVLVLVEHRSGSQIVAIEPRP